MNGLDLHIAELHQVGMSGIETVWGAAEDGTNTATIWTPPAYRLGSEQQIMHQCCYDLHNSGMSPWG